MTGFSPTVRRIIQERSDQWCERCTIEYGRQLHHRRPRGAGGTNRPESNDPSNGLFLCNACHAYVESHRTEALANGWLVLQTQEPADVPVFYRGGWVLLDALGNLEEAQKGA